VTNSLGGPLLLTNSPGALPPQAFYRVMISTSGGQTVPLLSADLAADGAYSGGWTNGCNGWTGLGPWTLTATSTNAGNDGFFLGSSTNNAFGSSPGIDTGGLAWGIYNGNFPARSWGMYANTGNTATAYRAFANGPVPVGGVFRVDMDTGFIDASSSVGFALCNGNASGSPAAYTNGARFIFEYIGQGAVNSYKVVDAGGLHNIGVGFTGAGLHLVFQLTATNTYTLLTIDNASGATNTFSGTLVGDPLQSVALFDNNAGSGPDHDTYFNSLQLTGP
jgi:hypothetical protein